MPDKHAVDHHGVDHYDERDLDELLDRALASYVDAEPDPSMRARIMARIDGATPPMGRRWLLGSVAACVAALLLALLLHPANHPPEDRVSKAPAIVAAPPPAVSENLDDSLTHSARPHIVAANRHSFNSRKPAPPRRSISLASAPLTGEEATLLRFAQQHPEQARQVLSPPPSGPLHIDPVIIAPIQIAALSASQPDAH